jgi:hypothetical protein
MRLTKEELQDLATKTTLNQQELDRYIEKCSEEHADDKRILDELKSIRENMSSRGVFAGDITVKLIAAMIKHRLADDLVVINNIVTNEVVSSMLSPALLLMLLKNKAAGMEALIKIALHNNADMRVLDTLVLYAVDNVEQLHKEILKSKLAVQFKEGSLWKIAKFAKELEVLKKVLECDNGLAESILEAIKKSSLYKANKINKLELDAAIENAKNNKIIADLRKELATERDGKGQAVDAVTAKDVDIAKLQGALVEAAKQHQEALKVEVDKVKQDAERQKESLEQQLRDVDKGRQAALDDANKLHQEEIAKVTAVSEQARKTALDNAARQHEDNLKAEVAKVTQAAERQKESFEKQLRDVDKAHKEELKAGVATVTAAAERQIIDLRQQLENTEQARQVALDNAVNAAGQHQIALQQERDRADAAEQARQVALDNVANAAEQHQIALQQERDRADAAEQARQVAANAAGQHQIALQQERARADAAEQARQVAANAAGQHQIALQQERARADAAEQARQVAANAAGQHQIALQQERARVAVLQQQVVAAANAPAQQANRQPLMFGYGAIGQLAANQPRQLAPAVNLVAPPKVCVKNAFKY